MAVDLTYPTSRVHQRADGTQNVPSGASVNVEGGTVALSTGALLSIADSAQMTLPVVTDTSNANLSNFGVSILASTAAQDVTLDAPDRAGLIKVIVSTLHGATTITKTVQLSGSDITGHGATAASSNILFTTRMAYTIVSISTSQWVPLYGGTTDKDIAFS